MKLYSYFRSSCSYRVRIALALKNIDFSYESIHLVQDGGKQFTPEFLKLNSKAEVPTLVDGDKILSQSVGIIKYLDSVNATPRLFPADPYLEAKCFELVEVINSGIQPIQNLSVMMKVHKDHGADKAEWCKYWIHKGFQALEPKLKVFDGPFAMGANVSAADCFIIPQVYNAERFKIDMKEFPKIASINNHCLELDAFKKAHPHFQPDTPEEMRGQL